MLFGNAFLHKNCGENTHSYSCLKTLPPLDRGAFSDRASPPVYPERR